MAAPAATPIVAPPSPSPPGQLRSGAQLWGALTVGCEMAADGLIALASFLAAYKIYRWLPIGRRQILPHTPYLLWALLGTGVALLALQWAGLYRCRGSLLYVREFEAILRAVAMQALLWGCLSFAVRELPTPRLLLAVVAVLMTAGLILERPLLRSAWW
ncbi:MAG: hypothetical protein ACRER7_01870, partial [Gammaproteobacteria bacterium]